MEAKYEDTCCELQGGMVEALSFNRKMRGYAFDYQGSQKLVFTVTEPKSSCFVRDHVIKISTANAWDFEVKGYFPDRDCAIVDSGGRTVAQVLVIIQSGLGYINVLLIVIYYIYRLE